MKARNREVNIFNMSLLDILCGALGAFCFMMLVLFPFWRPGGPQRQQIEQDNAEIQRQIEELKERLKSSGGGDAPAIVQQMSQLQQRLQQQQGQLNQALQRLDEADKTINSLKSRNPVTLGIEWKTERHDVDLYAQWQLNVPPGKRGPPPINPAEKQRAFFGDEINTECQWGPCWETWMLRDVPANLELKIYYKFFRANGNDSPAVVNGFYLWNGQFHRLPRVDMAREQTAVLVGSLVASADYQVAFRPAPELAESYRKLIEADRAQEQQQQAENSRRKS